MYKKGQKKLFILILVLLVLVMIPFMIIEIEGSKCDNAIKEFTDRGVLVYTSDTTEYYEVVKKYDYEDDSNIIDSLSTKKIGVLGDIYITSTNFGTTFITKYLCKKLRVGHMGIVYDNNYTCEIVGNLSKEENVVKLYDNDWYYLVNFNEFIVLRYKNKDEDFSSKMKEYLDSIMGKTYNFLVFYHAKDKYYCSDLISRAYKDGIGVDINKFFISTGASMIQNENTYITYYRREVNKGNIKYQVYFLGEYYG